MKNVNDDHEDESERGDTSESSDNDAKNLTPEEQALLEKQKAKKLVKQQLKKERRKQFRKEIKKAVKRDEKLKLLTESMLGPLFDAKKEQRRNDRRLFRVSFKDGAQMCAECVFDCEESPKQISDPTHVSENHNDIPWDEWEEEELVNWWDQPDLDEVSCMMWVLLRWALFLTVSYLFHVPIPLQDDELTKLCKKVLIASASKDIGEGNIEIKADKIHALVIKFVLKVHQRVKDKGHTWRETNNTKSSKTT